MIAHVLLVVLVGAYLAIVVLGHILLLPAGAQEAFRRRGEGYLDALRCGDLPDRENRHA